MKIAYLENIVIYIIIFLGVWLLKSYWFFFLLFFVNSGRINREEDNND